jgi:uncharacterized protein YndB with AHSA1/START domain
MSTSGGAPTTSRVAGRELVIERTFDAPRELVFKVWTQPEHVPNWFGPKGFTLPVFETDVRPGGVTRYCMRSSTGEESWGKSEFREVVPPERLVYTDWFADPQGNPLPDMPETNVTITFSDDSSDKTRVTILTQFKSEAELESLASTGMVEGWTDTLDRLAEYLPTAA